MRISDWSSDVCSSDLFGTIALAEQFANPAQRIAHPQGQAAIPVRLGGDATRLEYLDIAAGIERELDIEKGIAGNRSEERRVGKECVSTGRSRWATEH